MLFIIIPVLYLIIGTFAARAQVTASKVLDLEKVKDEVSYALDNLKHTSNCWLGRTYGEKWRTSSYSCDCNNRNEYKALRAKYVGAQQGRLPNPYPMVFAWPFMGYHKFLMSGTPKASATEISNEQRIEQLEKELKIGEIR